MSQAIEVLLAGWGQNLRQAEALLAAVPDRQMTEQPPGVVNHPAWTMAHLIHYHPAIFSLVCGEAVTDPATLPDAPRYDAGSTPINDSKGYPTKAELLSRYRDGHERIAEQLRQAPVERLDAPPGLPRWAGSFVSTGRLLAYLMVYHEATHLGQVMVWRRAIGLPSLE